MISIDQIEKGVASYLDTELMPKLDDNKVQKVIAGTAIGILIRRFGNIAQTMSENSTIKMLGIVDDKGDVDIDIIKEELEKQIDDREGLPVELPMIGKMTFYKADVDKLYKHIIGGKI
jgi:hypothetical protein